MNDTFKGYHIKIIKWKTKILICSKHYIDANIVLNNIKLEIGNNFTYLESNITNDERNSTDIISRIAQAK